MARKTTNLAKKMINSHKASILWYSKKENEVDDFFLGMAHGQSSMLERVLMEQNCYWGYGYIDKSGNPITPDHPEYAEWRRVYYIKN